MKIVYKGIEGQRVTDMRFEQDGYILKLDEHLYTDAGILLPLTPYHVFQSGAIVYDSAAEQADKAQVAAKAQAMIDNLPSWAEIEAAIEAVSSLAGMKVIVKKLARVVYWLARNQAN